MRPAADASTPVRPTGFALASAPPARAAGGPRFVLAMAWRESRASWRRLSLLVAAVAVGVGALVAINSFTANLQESVRRQARDLAGADLVLGSSSPFSPRAETRVAEIAATPGAELSRVARFAAMAFVPRTSGTRLVQVTAITGGYPFYGAIRTDPAGEWERLANGDGALVDPALLIALGARVGDELSLGEAHFPIRGTVLDFPGDVAVRAALGPRVFIPARRLEETGLVGFGSRVRHEAFVKLAPGTDVDRLAKRHRGTLVEERVSVRTVAEGEERTNRSLGRLGRYLGLVALIAVLLGGLGVASAVHVFIKRRLETLAVLRCLGASASQLLAIYLLQAAVLGLVGSAVGAGLGVGLQLLLPLVLGDFLPVDVSLRPSGEAIAAGLGVGAWIAVLFALQPLLAIRRISPLAVLRRPYEDAPPSRRDGLRAAAALALCLSVAALAVIQAGDIATGLAFAGGIGVAIGALALAAFGLIRAVRRFFPSRWPYVWRQGLANLFRPANQTVMVVLALGFGAFLLDTLVVVQHNLLRDLRTDAGGERPNLVLFDIQPDQRPAVEAELRHAGLRAPAAVPIVPMRISAVKGRPVAQMLARADEERERRDARSEGGADAPGRWALRREYRSTYRDGMTATERTVAGQPWAAGAWLGRAEGEVVPISVEEGLARELNVGIGDPILWDVQGRALATRVAHLREVEWARFETNFFVVFPEGPLAQAPQTYVTMTRVDDPALRVAFQRRIAERFPNVSALDVSEVQRAVEGVLARAALAIRSMAIFSLATGAVVLVGAVATSRYQRAREAVLLKTLGATRAQVLRVALAEYASLGALAALAALALSTAAGWALTRFLFEQRFAWPLPSLLALGAGIVTLSVAVGLASSLAIFRRPPLAMLRAE